MAAAALTYRALRPPHDRHPAAPSLLPRARARLATTATAAPSTRCRAVAADERPTDPAFPEGQNRGISGAVERPEADVVVIGSGLGRLCCAGLLARYGQDVLVLESHDCPGGAVHSFDIKGFRFDSGSSLFLWIPVQSPPNKSTCSGDPK